MVELEVPPDQADLTRATPGTVNGEPVVVLFRGRAADAWRAGGRRVVAFSVARPCEWRPWQREADVVTVTAVRFSPSLAVQLDAVA